MWAVNSDSSLILCVCMSMYVGVLLRTEPWALWYQASAMSLSCVSRPVNCFLFVPFSFLLWRNYKSVENSKNNRMSLQILSARSSFCILTFCQILSWQIHKLSIDIFLYIMETICRLLMLSQVFDLASPKKKGILNGGHF